MATYNTKLAEFYSAATGKTIEASSAILFGLFYAISNTSYVWGNLISYLTLRTDTPSLNVTSAFTENFTGNVELKCGKQFCPADVSSSGSKIVRPSDERLYIMIGCFLAFTISAVLIVVFLLPVLSTDESGDEQNAGTQQQKPAISLSAKLTQTARHIVNPRQLLLTPQLINVGLSQSFAQGEFTQAFVACSQGVAFVGFVMMCYGGSQILSSLVFGKLAELTNKHLCVFIATLFQLTLDLFLLFWTVDASTTAPLFLCAIVAGMVDAVWNSQLLALQGELFPEHQVAAFATYKVWESLGYIVGFAYSTSLCTRYKLIILIALLVVSGIGSGIYNLLRLRDRRRVAALP